MVQGEKEEEESKVRNYKLPPFPILEDLSESSLIAGVDCKQKHILNQTKAQDPTR